MHLHLQTYFNYCVRLKGKDTLHSVLCANDGQCARGDTHGEEGRLAYCTFPLLSLLLHLYQYVYTDVKTRVVGTQLFCTFHVYTRAKAHMEGSSI